MSLSLLQNYGSSSESESDTETPSNLDRSRTQPRPTLQKESSGPLGLGAKLSSILPPPTKKSAATTDIHTPSINKDIKHEKQKIQIIVNLPQEAQKPSSERSQQNTAPIKTYTPSSIETKSAGVFSDLASILPAPKNNEPLINKRKRDHEQANPSTSKAPCKRPSLVPHSVSSKRRANLSQAKVQFSDSDENKQTIKAEDDKALQHNGPFFTIGVNDANLPEPPAIEGDENTLQQIDSLEHDTDSQNHQESQLHYDPTSGYYYDPMNGLYYYYDVKSGMYVDASTLSFAEDTEGISNTAMENLVGHGAAKRSGWIEGIGAVKEITQNEQLADSEYSDIKAGSQFRAAQMAQENRVPTISEGSVDRKKKQKHNIMFLALQSQEQKAKLQEAHADGRKAKKEARKKYGF